MSELSSTQIPKPSDEQAFERCNEVLWRLILEDPTAKLYGRRGQKQQGVDILGIRGGESNHLVGIQCKLKSDGRYLDQAEVRKEVKKALTFQPPLSEFIIATTAPTDAHLDQLARELSISASEGRDKNIKISVFGWNDLEREINRFPEARKAFDPSHTPYSELNEDKIDLSSGSIVAGVSTALAPEFDSLRLELQRIKTINAATRSPSVDSEQEQQINDCVELMASDPSGAMGMLRNLENRLSGETNPRIRFRVAANIAACQLELGDVDVAAQGFIDAWELAPEEPKAIGNKAYGLLLKEDFSALKEFARLHIHQNTDNAGLAACYVHSLMEDEKVIDPLVELPEAVIHTPEVAEAHIRWTMRRGEKGAWWQLAICAHLEHPDNEPLVELYASALLDRVLGGEPLQVGRFLDEAEQADAATARRILTRKWQEMLARDCQARPDQATVPLNLIVVLQLLEESQLAVEVGNEAVGQFPDDPTIREYAALMLAQEGASDQALELVSDLEPNRRNVGLRFTLACSSEDWSTVRSLVDNHLEAFPETEQEFINAIRDRAHVELAPAKERRPLLEKAYDQFQGNARAMIALSQCARIHGYIDLATACFVAGLTAFEAKSNEFISRLEIAQEAISRREPGIAADILVDQIPLDRDSAELRLLGQALVNDYPIRDRAVRFFENLTPTVRNLPAFLTLLGVLHFNRGVPKEAIGPFAGAFEHEPSISTLMRLIRAQFSAEERDAVRALLKLEGVDALPGSPLDRIEYCHVLLDFAEGIRAIELAYRALVDGVNQAEVVGKFIGLILKPSPYRPDHSLSVIAPNTWVRLKSSTGDSFEALLGEPESRRWGNKADLDNSFVAQILGFSTGDTIEQINPLTGLVEEWTVGEVKPNWLQAFHHLIGDFNQTFPDAPRFARVPLSEDNIQPVLDQVRRYSANVRRMADLYLVDGLPMAFIAGNEPGAQFGFAHYLISIEEDVRVCRGTHEERSSALTLIKDNNRRGAVLDAFTALHGATLGILPVLTERLGPLAIPSSEFQRLTGMSAEQEALIGEETMTLAYQDGQYVRHVVSPDEHVTNLSQLKTKIEAIEDACIIEPTVIPDNLSEFGEALVGLPFGDAVASGILAHENRLLLSEDMMIRQLSINAFGTKGVWLQVVLMSAVEAGTLGQDSYADSIVHLAAHRHGYVTMGAIDLFSIFQRDNTDRLERLEILYNYLGNRNADLKSHMDVSAQFLNNIWDNGSWHELKLMKATHMLFRALFCRFRGSEWTLWAASLYIRLHHLPRRCLKHWCQGHFLPYQEVQEVVQKLWSGNMHV